MTVFILFLPMILYKRVLWACSDVRKPGPGSLVLVGALQGVLYMSLRHAMPKHPLHKTEEVGRNYSLLSPVVLWFGVLKNYLFIFNVFY